MATYIHIHIYKISTFCPDFIYNVCVCTQVGRFVETNRFSQCYDFNKLPFWV